MTKPAAATLTSREWDVLGRVAMGETNKEIAEVLGLTVNTVKTYLEQARAKLNARNRAQAIALSGVLHNGRNTMDGVTMIQPAPRNLPGEDDTRAAVLPGEDAQAVLGRAFAPRWHVEPSDVAEPGGGDDDPWCPNWCDPSHCEFRTGKRGAMFHRGTLATICEPRMRRPRVVAWRAQNGYDPDGQFVVMQMVSEDPGGEAETVATYWFKLDESLRMSMVLSQLGSTDTTTLTSRGAVPVPGAIVTGSTHTDVFPPGPDSPFLDTP